MTYNPWLDAYRRYPHMHIEWLSIAPFHAMVATQQDVIFVDENITKAERRCALAHELAHLDAGDAPTDRCFFYRRQETIADAVAARRLIDVRDLAGVTRYCDDPREIAAELEVTLNVLALRGRLLTPPERRLVNRSMSRRVAVA